MKSPALTLTLLSAGQALASLNCTVIAPILTKRLCEADSCPAYDTVSAGVSIHVACRADCSTDDDPWLKLYDGTFVRASSATLSGCRYFCQPYSVLGLPRCHEQQGTAKPVSCATSGLKAVKPVPQAPEAAPLPAVARLCNLTAPTPALHRRTVRSRAFVPRYINGTFSSGIFANGTGPTLQSRDAAPAAAARTENTTYASHAPAPVQRRATLPPFPFSNGTSSNATATHIYARGINITSNTTPRLQARAHGVLPRVPYLNTTLPRIQTRATNTTAAGTVPFANSTFTAAGIVGKKPPVVARAPHARKHLPLPVPFYA